MHSAHIESGHPKTSIYDDLDWLANPVPPASPAAVPFPAFVIQTLLRSILTELLLLIKHTLARPSMVEWELEKPEFLDSRSRSSQQESISTIYPWHRRLPYYLRMVARTYRKIDPKVHSSFLSIPTSHFASLDGDLDVIQKELKELCQWSRRLQSDATAFMSHQESRTGTGQNLVIMKLANIAIFFLPLSFITGLFSMTTNVRSLKHTFWVYAITVLVFILVAWSLIKFRYLLRLLARALVDRWNVRLWAFRVKWPRNIMR
jgi:Mg2+ and Co2+ transporter CorA